MSQDAQIEAFIEEMSLSEAEIHAIIDKILETFEVGGDDQTGLPKKCQGMENSGAKAVSDDSLHKATIKDEPEEMSLGEAEIHTIIDKILDTIDVGEFDD